MNKLIAVLLLLAGILYLFWPSVAPYLVGFGVTLPSVNVPSWATTLGWDMKTGILLFILGFAALLFFIDTPLSYFACGILFVAFYMIGGKWLLLIIAVLVLIAWVFQSNEGRTRR